MTTPALPAQNAVAPKEVIKNLKYELGGMRTDRGMDVALKDVFEVAHDKRPK